MSANLDFENKYHLKINKRLQLIVTKKMNVSNAI